MTLSEVQAVGPALILMSDSNFMAKSFCGVANHNRQVTSGECREIISAVSGKDNIFLSLCLLLSPRKYRRIIDGRSNVCKRWSDGIPQSDDRSLKHHELVV